jgi:hypothetical protein
MPDLHSSDLTHRKAAALDVEISASTIRIRKSG